jgi:hypothetical protein
MSNNLKGSTPGATESFNAILEKMKELKQDLKQYIRNETEETKRKVETEIDKLKLRTEEQMAQINQETRNKIAELENKTTSMVADGMRLTEQADEIKRKEETGSEESQPTPEERGSAIMNNASSTVSAIMNMGSQAKRIATSLNNAILGKPKGVEDEKPENQLTSGAVESTNKPQAVTNVANEQVNQVVNQKPSNSLLREMGLITTTHNNSMNQAATNLLGTGNQATGTQMVADKASKISAPNNFVNKPINQLTDEELANLTDEQMNKLLAKAKSNTSLNANGTSSLNNVSSQPDNQLTDGKSTGISNQQIKPTKALSEMTDENMAALSEQEIEDLLAESGNNLESGVIPENDVPIQKGGNVTFNGKQNRTFLSLQNGGSKRKNLRKKNKTHIKSQNLEMKLEKAKHNKRTLRKTFRGKYDKILEKPKINIHKSATSDESLFFQEPLIKRQTQSGGGINKNQNKNLFGILFG